MSKSKPTSREKVLLLEVSGWPEHLQEEFHRIVRKGNTIPMAHMLVLRSGPALQTDTAFVARQPKFKDLPDSQRENIAKAAIKDGYNPKPDDSYHPGIAMKKGDRDAFVNPVNGRGHLKKLAQKRRVDMFGSADVKGRSEPHKDPRDHAPRLSRSIVSRHLMEQVKQDPGLLQRRSKRDVCEEIVDKHTRKKK